MNYIQIPNSDVQLLKSTNFLTAGKKKGNTTVTKLLRSLHTQSDNKNQMTILGHFRNVFKLMDFVQCIFC